MSEVIKNETKEEESNPIQKAERVLAELKAENERAAFLNKEKEELIAREMLSGRSEAGSTPTVKKEETAKEYAERVMRGES